jgi:hypothetical protein
MDNINPAVKQYLIFSAVIALIVSLIVNFMLIESLKGTPFYGFPVNLTGSEGLGNFFYRIINTIVESLLLIIPVYLIIQWLLTRGRGGYDY